MIRPGAQRGLRQALAYAMAGLRYAVLTQRTFRIQLAIAAAIGLLTLYLRLPALETAVVILAVAVVLAAELLNTGIEVVVDLLVERNEHQLAKTAKDIAAGGVVLAIVTAVVVGVLILGPPLGAVAGLGAGSAGRLARAAALGLVVAGGAGLLWLRRGKGGGGHAS